MDNTSTSMCIHVTHINIDGFGYPQKLLRSLVDYFVIWYTNNAVYLATGCNDCHKNQEVHFLFPRKYLKGSLSLSVKQRV